MNEYLEIIKFEGDQIVKRIDVTGMSAGQQDKLDRGLNINLNHEEYFTTINVTEETLAAI
jgi:hypothetical protein